MPCHCDASIRAGSTIFLLGAGRVGIATARQQFSVWVVRRRRCIWGPGVVVAQRGWSWDPRELSTKRGQGYSSLSWLRAHQSDQSLKSCNAASHTGASQNYCKTTVLNQCSKRMMDRRLARVQPSEQSRSMRGRHVLISKISVFSPYQLQGKRSPMPSASDDLAAHLAGSAMAERYC